MRRIPLWAMPFLIGAIAFATAVGMQWVDERMDVDWGLSVRHAAIAGLAAVGIAAWRWAVERRAPPLAK